MILEIDMLTEKQQKLADSMSEVSERTWAASWYIGVEFLIWQALETGNDLLSSEETIKIQQLHEDVDGWVVHDVTQPGWRRFVSTTEWVKIYDDWVRLNELDKIKIYTRARYKAPQYITGPDLFDYDIDAYFTSSISALFGK
jgi:hypothetical protein